MTIQKPFYKKQWARCILALIFGASGTLAYAPFSLWGFALFSLAGLLLLIQGTSNKQSAAIGYCWGLGLFTSGVHWVYVSIQFFGGLPVLFSAALVLLLAAYLSLYTLLFATLLNRFWPKATLIKYVFAAPALWTLTEFLRGWVLTGFPWLQFGYTQIDGPLKGLAPILGVDAITFILMLIAGLICYSLIHKRLRLAICAVLVLIIFMPLRSLHWYTKQTDRTANIVLVQGNIEQSLKWIPNQLQPTIEKYLTASHPFIGKAQLIIWPEVAIPDSEGNQEDLLKLMDSELRQQHTALLTGIVDRRFSFNQRAYYNTLITLGDAKTPYQFQDANRYHKRHLVIFGEYIPFKSILRPIAGFFDLPMSSMSTGSDNQPLIQANGYNITSAICYEVILGRLVRENFSPDTDFLVTVSNDAWFGDSIGPWQHFEMARMRALELGRPLLRSTNTGITAAINANGKIIKQLPQFKYQVLNVDVKPTTGLTPYARFGSWPLWLISTVFFVIAFVRRKKSIHA